MCGIVAGYVGTPSTVKEMVRKIYMDQKTRGVKGYGLGVRKRDGSLLRDRSVTEEEIFDSWLWQMIDVGDYFLFHHRTPTSTFNTPECNHPIMNETQNLMVVHNGSLSTFPLFNDHVFETEVLTTRCTRGTVVATIVDWTDTEVAAHYMEELVYMCRGGWRTAIRLLGNEFKSTFLFLSEDYDGILYSARSNPLFVYKIGKNVFLSSQRGIVKDINTTKDLEPGFGSINRGVVHHEKPEEWLTTRSYACHNETEHQKFMRENNVHTWNDYIDYICEERSGNTRKKRSVRTVMPEAEVRIWNTPNRTVMTGGTDFTDYTVPTGKSGKDWPGHPAYVQPHWTIPDKEIDLITLIKEREFILKDMNLNSDQGEEYPDEWYEEEDEDGDNEQWLARCGLYNIYMPKREHELLYPNCTDDCDQCTSSSCPFHPSHVKMDQGVITDMIGRTWYANSATSSDDEAYGYGGMV